MISAGLVRVVDQAPSRGGRPSLLLGLVGGAANALGVKVVADHLVGVRVDLDGVVVDRFEHRFQADDPGAIERLAALLLPHIEPREDSPLFLGVGLGVPGVVDGGEHSVVDSPMLGWHSLDVGELLEQRLGVPVLVDNDVNTLAVASRLYGRGKDVDDFLTVTIGRGVGLGIIVGGNLYRGAHGGAGEFGHVAVVENGPRCECGKDGCLEALVADPALVARGRREGLLRAGEGVERLRALAEAGDLRAARIFGDAGGILRRAVAGLLKVPRPELGLSFASWDLLTHPRWVGLANYRGLAHDGQFHAALLHTLYFVAGYLPLVFCGGLLLALALHQRLKGVAWLRTLYFLPVVTSWV